MIRSPLRRAGLLAAAGLPALVSAVPQKKRTLCLVPLAGYGPSQRPQARARARVRVRVRVRVRFFCCAVLSVLVPALESSALDQVANEPALRVNAQVIGVREILALYADSRMLIQDKLARGELKPQAREAAVREAWAGALQTAIQDALLDQLSATMRREIIDAIVAFANPGTPPSRRLEFFERHEADLIQSLRKALLAAAGGEQALREELKRKGKSMQAWEAGLRLELFRREVLARSLGPIPNSPAAARAYFEAHPEEFCRPEAWRLRRIRVPKAKFSTPEAAAQAAAAVKKKLDEGQDFAQLAAALQYDPAHDARGGLLTLNGKTALPAGSFPLEERIAAGLKDRACSEPVDAGDAFLIVLREGFRPGLSPTYEESAERAAALAFEERVARTKQEFFESKKKESYIEIIKKEPPAELFREE